MILLETVEATKMVLGDGFLPACLLAIVIGLGLMWLGLRRRE